jgi:hypothetical protein
MSCPCASGRCSLDRLSLTGQTVVVDGRQVQGRLSRPLFGATNMFFMLRLHIFDQRTAVVDLAGTAPLYSAPPDP